MGAVPGVGPKREFTYNELLISDHGKKLLGKSLAIDGTYGVDFRNWVASSSLYSIRHISTGMPLGKLSSGLVVPLVLGKLPTDYNTGVDGTTMDVGVAAANAIYNSWGSVHDDKIRVVGAPADGGVVSEHILNVDAIDLSAGTLTLGAALGTAEVQTLTLTDGTDGGSFRAKYEDAVSAVLAWDISAANLQTALRALHTDLAAVTVGLVGAVYTVTWPKTTGPMSLIEVITDFTADGGVYEGGITVARTATGVNGDFVDGSLILIDDAVSAAPVCILGDSQGVDTEDDGNIIDAGVVQPVIGGQINTSVVAGWPTSTLTTLVTWYKAYLRTLLPDLLFDVDY